jgi:hypothetical protein
LATPTTTTSSIVTNPLAKPKFKGDREKVVEIVDGYPGLAEYIRKRQIVPRCFSDPNLESGVCNPGLALDPKKNEPHLCAFAKSCLVAKLLSCGIKCSPFEAREKPYEEVLAEADALFDQEPDEETPGEADETKDRQIIRGHSLSISLQPPVNPFRKNSIRRLVLDILARDWISLSDLKAVLMSKKGIKRLDLIVHQVTSIATQEHYGYRIIESMGRFKAFKR